MGIGMIGVMLVILESVVGLGVSTHFIAGVGKNNQKHDT